MNDETVAVVKECLAKWESVSGIKFIFLGKNKAGIIKDSKNTISILNIVPNDIKYKIGYTYNWQKKGFIDESDIIVNATIGKLTSKRNNIPQSYYLETILLHEIGHALGLPHSMNPQSVMYKDISIGVCKDEIDPGTILKIKELYSQ